MTSLAALSKRQLPKCWTTPARKFRRSRWHPEVKRGAHHRNLNPLRHRPRADKDHPGRLTKSLLMDRPTPLILGPCNSGSLDLNTCIDPTVSDDSVFESLQPAFRSNGRELLSLIPLSEGPRISEFDARCRVEDRELSLWLRTMTEDVPKRGFMPALVSLRHLADDSYVPVTRQFTILVHPRLGFPCCVSPHPIGASGAALASERPLEVLAEIGRTIQHLENTAVPHFGRLASRRMFHPERDTWEEEWCSPST